MLFVELRFFVFIFFVLAVHWSLQKNDHRKWFLLGASYFFYGCWEWRFAFMLLALSIADYLFSKQIYHSFNKRTRLAYVIASVAMNLSVLAYFKYFNFFVGSAVQAANYFGLHLSEFTLSVTLPVGVSFFTFQSLSYTIDVYRGDIPPARSLRDYLLFSSFFPQLVAGPIVRPSYFLPQLDTKTTLSFESAKHFLLLFLIGFFKKACIADNISPYVDRFFHDPQSYSAMSTIGGVWLYATQIYCDFSGYSDMAIATAGFLGYRLVLNFDVPYLATSLQDFWRRWHMSLSLWIRDYIYFSLGGRHIKVWMTYRNLLITMILGGLWHGAAWTFVVWGALHGLGLVLNHEFKRIFGTKYSQGIVSSLVGWFLTINFVCISWIFFRAADFQVAQSILNKYLLLDTAGTLNFPVWLVCLPPGLLLVQYAHRKMDMSVRVQSLGGTAFAMSYGCIWAVAISLLPLGYRPFIYFQF